MVKNLPAMQETQGLEKPLEKGMATHPSILVWRISWTEEPGGIQSIGRIKIIYKLSDHTNQTLSSLEEVFSKYLVIKFWL